MTDQLSKQTTTVRINCSKTSAAIHVVLSSAPHVKNSINTCMHLRNSASIYEPKVCIHCIVIKSCYLIGT